MRKYILLLFFLFTTLLLQAQWIQTGADIDGEAADDLSGSSVCLSSDGSILAIGATGNEGNGILAGHTRVYQNQSGNWIQIGDDIDSEAANNGSGISVSLSSDGSIVAIGARGNSDNGLASGHVRIFKNISGTWSQIGNDIDGEAAYDGFGISTSLNSEGSIVAIGAARNDGNGTDSGHVRIYENQNENWVQVGDDIDGEAAGDSFGRTVSMNSEGSIVAIGAQLNDGNGIDSGHARVYQNQSGTWVQMGDDIDGAAADDFFNSVSLSSDGTVVAIGAQGNDDNGSASGHVRVFKYLSGLWSQMGNDINGDAAFDNSGRSGEVSLSSDGSVVAIGATGNSENGFFSGQVRVFQYINTQWIQVGMDIDGEAEGDFFGDSVSLSSDGSVVAIGATFNDGNGDDSGHVRVFNNVELSIEDFELNSNKITVYPNPAKGVLHIVISNNLTIKSIEVYNMLGTKIKTITTSFESLDVSNLNNGIYFLKFNTNNGVLQKKIMAHN